MLLLQPVYAQTTSGKILYTETRKLHINLKNEDIQINGVSSDQANQIAAMIPKEQVSKKILRFTPEAALYETAKVENNDATSQQGNMQIMINFSSGGDNKSYHDIKNKQLVEQNEFMSRKFLVTSDIGKNEWKMTGNQKEILGYPCQQATMLKDTQTVTAWFTPAIPVSAGPKGTAGLPGMILAMDIGDDLSVIATSIEAGGVDAKELSKPNEGKKVTKEQYKKIVDDKVKEMQSESGGNGIIIKTEVRH